MDEGDDAFKALLDTLPELKETDDARSRDWRYGKIKLIYSIALGATSSDWRRRMLLQRAQKHTTRRLSPDDICLAAGLVVYRPYSYEGEEHRRRAQKDASQDKPVVQALLDKGILAGGVIVALSEGGVAGLLRKYNEVEPAAEQLEDEESPEGNYDPAGDDSEVDDTDSVDTPGPAGSTPSTSARASSSSNAANAQQASGEEQPFDEQSFEDLHVAWTPALAKQLHDRPRGPVAAYIYLHDVNEGGRRAATLIKLVRVGKLPSDVADRVAELDPIDDDEPW